MMRALLQFTLLSGLMLGIMAIEPFEFIYEDKEIVRLRSQGEVPEWAKTRKDIIPTKIEDDDHVASR